MLLTSDARLHVQPGPYTSIPSSFEQKVGGYDFEWIPPIGKRAVGSKVGFDVSALPVKLAAKEVNQKLAALWSRNQADTSPKTNGGAYITLDAGDPMMGKVGCGNQAKYGQVDVFSVAYRLAPGSKYPCQLYEAYSAFAHLKRKGHRKILIGGDSAGAHIALFLWKYLEEVSGEADIVPGLILYSPWVDINGFKRASFQKNIHSCLVTTRYATQGFASIQTNGLPKATDPNVNPLSWSADVIKRLPPVFMSNGGAECLLEEGIEFAAKLRHNGVDITHRIQDGHPHDFQVMPYYPTAIKDVFTASGEFIKKRGVHMRASL